jgi:oligopeptide/dipeptide ABC transporter ATP-binding protein
MLLEVRNLSSSFFLDEGELRAVDDVSFDIGVGETVALVGESGCGKTIVALSLVQLINPPGRVKGGQVVYEDRDLLKLRPEGLRRVRGKQIGMIYQDPGAALNPVYTIGSQIVEVLRLHRGLDPQSAWREAVRLLGEMGIPEPEKRARSYPFELSGGMQQRALIAIAVGPQPRLLIADEPTTALDLTVQAEILDLLRYLRDEYEMATLLISHDIGMVADIADRIMVMYAGRLVEIARTRELFEEPKHPYTKALLDAVPRLGEAGSQMLSGIPGRVPDLLDLPAGCAFHPRCPIADDECTTVPPPMRDVPYSRRCACYHMKARR